MKRSIILSILALVLALPMAAQVRLGIRGGMTVGKLRFDRDIVSSDNRVGYTGGLLLDLNIPVVGLGLEVSAMYTHRNNRLTDHMRVFKRHFFDFPLLARYRLTTPRVERIIAPYVFTGPCFSVLFDEGAKTDLDDSKTYLSWDVGGGVDLFRHLRVTASYSIGISKAMSYIDREYTGAQVHGKDRCWTLSAAYLF